MKILKCMLLLIATNVAFAQEVVTVQANGEINWTEGVVYAQGFGVAREGLPAGQRRLLARRAAIVDGQRNLLELTKGVRITSLTKVVDAMLDNSVTASRVEGVVKGAVPIKETYQNDVFAVTMAMPIGGQLLKVVYEPMAAYVPIPINNNKDRIQQQLFRQLDEKIIALENFLIPRASAGELFVIENDKEARAIKRVIEWVGRQPPEQVSAGLKDAVQRFETGQYSGLLVDASNVAGFELATVPRIRDEDGNVIYPTEDTSYDDIVNKRGVSYDFDLEDAIRNQRVATVPLVVNATSTYKNLTSDLVISRQDADRIVGSISTRTAMNKTGVLIVVPL